MISFRLLISLAMFALCAAPTARAWTPNAQEQDIASRMKSASGQRRASLTFDPILSQVARERAADMAKRGYFDHTNPDGHGANYLVRKAGYILPSGYPGDGNNIESIAAGGSSAGTTWGDWMGSSDHKKHILGEISFFAAQTSYGIGFYEDAGSPYRYYWVVITAPPMPNPATLTIVSPADGAEKPEGAVAVAGTTGGAQAAASVQISVENADGSTAWQTVSGAQSWSASLNDLAPGPNTLHARSLTSDGTVLAEATRTFQYVVLRPLTIHVEGQGSVGRFAGTTSRQLGKAYTITAIPAEDWLFAGWSGSWAGSHSRATFVMRAGLDATATFVPNPFLARRGAYSGLVGDDAAALTARGLLRLELDRLGQFTGRLFFAGKSYALLGRFGFDAKASVKIPRGSGTPLKLKLDLNGATGQIAGTLTDGATAISLSIAPALQSGTALAALAGRYTVSFPADTASTDPAVPKGDGYGMMVVDKKGRATLAGTLADGTAFSRGGWIAADGRLAFYAPLYKTRGALSGLVTFSDATSSDLTGPLRWTKPRRAHDAYFPQAFDTTLASIGARYTAPAAGQPVLAVSSANPNAQLVLGDGDLSGEIIQPAHLRNSNVVSLGAPALPGLTVAINAGNGSMKGTFKHPANGAVTKFRGVILRKQNAGAGFFLGVDQSGSVKFVPAQ